MKAALILGVCALSFAASASDILDSGRGLDAEIQAWKPGCEVPRRLLSFPTGNVPPRQMCGLAAIGMSAAPYIERIENDALLEELVFDPRTESMSLYAAITALVEQKGLGWFANKLATRADTRWELDALKQVIRFPFSRIEVAYISANAMQQPKALEVLGGLKSELDSGKAWKDAYGKVSDQNPDVERRKLEPGAPVTLVGYWFGGWISASGYTFSGLGFNRNLPIAHLKRVVGASHGGYILESGEGAYLYYVFESWTPDV
jgi:hypothetical protein